MSKMLVHVVLDPEVYGSIAERVAFAAELGLEVKPSHEDRLKRYGLLTCEVEAEQVGRISMCDGVKSVEMDGVMYGC